MIPAWFYFLFFLDADVKLENNLFLVYVPLNEAGLG